MSRLDSNLLVNCVAPPGYICAASPQKNPMIQMIRLSTAGGLDFLPSPRHK